MIFLSAEFALISYFQTALSQCHNLFFVAYIDKVHIFKPRFPHQTITSEPELIIDIAKSGRGVSGYIDPRRPHAINHLVIGDLGSQEILVVACDDGDVVAYTVRNITRAMEKKVENYSGESA